MKIRLFMFIGIGGMIGAVARYSLSILFNELSGFPYATLVTNLLGCFSLSFLLNNEQLKQWLSTEIRTALGTGIIGSFTTFSTFTLETFELWNNHLSLAFIYIFMSICGGLGFCYIGFKLARYRQRSDTI